MIKNIKKYLKLYHEKCEESLKKWGYYYPPRNWEEFEKWNQDTFEKYLQDLSDEISKTKLYISLLNNTKEFGFYLAFNNQDFELLNNVLYQIARQEILSTSVTESGTDHCNAFFDVLSAFACNDFQIIESLFPKELPHSKGQFYTENAVNLLKVLYFKEEDLKQIALQKAEKFLQKKITAWEKFVVLYFVALVEKDAQKASNCLQELCEAYQKLGYPREKIDKCFAQEIHGLYRLVRELDANLFTKIEMPTHDCFFQEFEIWQQKNQFPKGKLFYTYPPKMDYMNQIFNAPMPKMELFEKTYSENRKYIFKNADKFAVDLTRSIKENL
ncbi:hypothetical protein CGC48_02835 [Capnocytophaga cynodegmi]|uniref:Uncharacterized protein n=1 Tax=Capnocytophaga cynodegmi TaxID=28189 RepID=A0A286NU26_9FLAO|nr:hypothetical protein [Capnocytophaga cynodegmi]ATA67663.1 hypothetical protein CGC48_02835 [Capnocytophaga cynodegmi]